MTINQLRGGAEINKSFEHLHETKDLSAIFPRQSKPSFNFHGDGGPLGDGRRKDLLSFQSQTVLHPAPGAESGKLPMRGLKAHTFPEPPRSTLSRRLTEKCGGWPRSRS
jgi:hypothetical protein